MNRTTTFLAAAGGLALLAVLVGLPKLRSEGQTHRPAVPSPLPVAMPTPSTPTPRDGSLKLESRLSHPYVTPGQSDVFLTLDLTAADVPGAERAPVNLAVVLDRSGSMAGQKLDQAKEAAQHLVRQLRDSDRLTLIHFGSDVRELRALPATDANKATMRRFIDGIIDDGGTNIGGALTTAERELRSGLGDYKFNRIILITDGQPTEGLTDSRSLIGVVQRIHGSGITVSAIGVGADFNEDLLQQFAEYGAGSYGFMEDTAKLATLFQKDLQQAGTTVARNVELSVQLPAGVELDEALGHRVVRDGQTVRIPMTDFSAGQVERVVARLTIRAPEAGRAFDVAGVRVDYQDLLQNAPASSNIKLAAMVTDKREEVLARRDKDVAVIAARAVAANNMVLAADALSRGDEGQARKWVQRNEEVFKEAEQVAGHGAVAQDEADFAPQGFAAAPAAEVPTMVKSAKARALKGLGRIGSTY
jgi:Ca-activated chloride channel family protein